jgi:hypothetical protein
MQNLTDFLTAFDPLALLFVAGVVAFVVVGGIAIMKDIDVSAFGPTVSDDSGAAEPSTAEPVPPSPTHGPEHGGAGGRRRRRAA